MSQNRVSDTGGIDSPTSGETSDESLVFEVSSESTGVDRWPQLERGYSANDFGAVRATVAVEWDDIDHEDLDVDPEELLDQHRGT